jgi:tetratricopeptide (TPR) repeat protein
MRASASLLMRARICTHAGDYFGAVQVLNEVLPQFQEAKLVPHTRDGQALLASAMIGLGEIGQGLKILRGVDEDMVRQLVPYDRYLRPVIEWGFVAAYMESGDIQNAERHLQRLVDSAEQLGEVTWQGLAWEAGARLALARNDVEEASERLSTALNLIEGYEVPLASWKIHACAAEAEEILGHRSVAAGLRRGAAATIRALANSLPDTDPIRQAFLSSSRVRSVLEAR